MHDIRFALRLLARERTFALTSVLTLGICLAANVSIFSVVNSVLLNPLPVPESDRLVLMYNSYPRAGAPDGSTAVPDYFDRLQAIHAFERQAVYRTEGFDVGERGNPQRMRGMRATPSFFDLTGVRTALGRPLVADDAQQGRDHKVVLSHALWRDQFARDPNVAGRELRVNGEPYTIVGVMPESFTFDDPDVKLWVPAWFTAEQRSDDSRHSNNWTYVGRLRAGATMAQAQAQVDALNAANLDRFPQFKEILINAGFHTVAVNFREHLVKDVRGVLYLLWGAVVFVLLIGCVNVANLSLVRSTVRLRELATRMALGAGRLRIARQLVTESVILTGLAGGVGLALGAWAIGGFKALGLEQLPRGGEVTIDASTLAFAAALAAFVGVAIGGIPVAHVLRSNVNDVLRQEGRSGTATRGARRLRHALVAAEVALAFLLLVGAGLLLASFQRTLAIDPGFDPRGVLTASIALPTSRYADDAAVTAFVERAVKAVGALPSVRAAGVTTTIPFGGSYSDSAIMAEGYTMAPGESIIAPSALAVSPGYIEAMGIRLLKGRPFEARDTAAAPLVALVDEELAARFWKGRDPIGRRMYLPDTAEDLITPGPKVRWITVVGVVARVRLQSLTRGDGDVGAYYFPVAQVPRRNLTFAIKSEVPPASLTTTVRATLAKLDPDMPVYATYSMEERVSRSLTDRRTPLVLALAFGGIALLLSAIGIYGVLSYLVTQRTREIGIRLALGSTSTDILSLVVREGLTVVGIGFVIGFGGALALRRVLESQLYGVRATDPSAFGLAIVVLGAVALAACLIPAWRAARVSPAEALS
ncbi:MAG TPA: ABC transporter permease [Vicinamibacterales bacterium]|nr:ABC transporter permease [Vicinamibacterales bacterium]